MNRQARQEKNKTKGNGGNGNDKPIDTGQSKSETF